MALGTDLQSEPHRPDQVHAAQHVLNEELLRGGEPGGHPRVGPHAHGRVAQLRAGPGLRGPHGAGQRPRQLEQVRHAQVWNLRG